MYTFERGSKIERLEIVKLMTMGSIIINVRVTRRKEELRKQRTKQRQEKTKNEIKLKNGKRLELQLIAMICPFCAYKSSLKPPELLIARWHKNR